jgi:hypothetical protein
VTHASQPQPAPTQSTASSKVLPDVLCHPMLAGDNPINRKVVADFESRAKAGTEKYGVFLHTHNGRDALMDLYQELVDGAMYARQASLEAEDRDIEIMAIYEETLRAVKRVRAKMLADRGQ